LVELEPVGMAREHVDEVRRIDRTDRERALPAPDRIDGRAVGLDAVSAHEDVAALIDAESSMREQDGLGQVDGLRQLAALNSDLQMRASVRAGAARRGRWRGGLALVAPHAQLGRELLDVNRLADAGAEPARDRVTRLALREPDGQGGGQQVLLDDMAI